MDKHSSQKGDSSGDTTTLGGMQTQCNRSEANDTIPKLTSMSENNAMTEGAASEEAITAEKNQLAECWAHVVRITLGWMKDINDRMPSIAWGATAPHRAFIEFIEKMSEETTFEEFKRQAQLLMLMHAQARNDIYDGYTYETNLDDDGRDTGEWEVVSRQEKDVRALCQIWWKR